MIRSFFTSLLVIFAGCKSSVEIGVQRFEVEKLPPLINVGSGLESVPVKSKGVDTQFFYSVSDGDNQAALLLIKVKKNIADIEDTILIKSDAKLDLEGVALSDNGNLWLANEKGPSLIEYNLKNEKIEKIISPGNGLPAILMHMQPGRGFEGVAVIKDQVIAAMQSVLDIDGKTKDTAQFIRLVAFHRTSGQTAMFAYPIETSIHGTKREVMIGDIARVDDRRILVLEREGGQKNNDLSVKIYLCDLGLADDISGIKIGEKDLLKELEFEKDHSKLFGSPLSGKGGLVRPVPKQLILDLSAVNWKDDQPEGLTLLSDFQTIAVSNSSGSGPPALWIIKLPNPLVKFWMQKIIWSFALIAMAALIWWSLIPSDKKTQFEVAAIHKDHDLVIAPKEEIKGKIDPEQD